MPQPEGRQLSGGNYSPFLTQLAINYLPDPKSPDYIAKQLFPNIPVGSPVGQYNVWHQDDFLRLGMKQIANDEAAPIIGFSTGTGTYQVGNYGVAAYYTARDVANYRRTGGSEALLRNGKVRLVAMNGVLTLEKLTADLCQTGANWASNYTGVSTGATMYTGGSNFLAWDQAGSDPVQDIDEVKRRFRLATTFRLNKLVIPEQVWLGGLKKNQSLIDRIKYGGTAQNPTQVTLDQLKMLFGIDDILIPGGVYNAAAEGQVKNIQYFWGKNVWFGYTTDAPMIDQPSAGYHFSWTGDSETGLPEGVAGGVGPAQFGATMSDDGLFIRYYDENRPARRFVEAELWTAPSVTASDMGGVMQGVIS